MKYLYIIGTVVFTVYGQLILKWRMNYFGETPIQFTDKFLFVSRCLLDVYVLSGLLSAFIAALFWMSAVSIFPLSYAYPFMGLNFVIVMLFSSYLFKEPVTITNIIGTLLVVIGIVIISLNRH